MADLPEIRRAALARQLSPHCVLSRQETPTVGGRLKSRASSSRPHGAWRRRSNPQDGEPLAGPFRSIDHAGPAVSRSKVSFGKAGRAMRHRPRSDEGNCIRICASPSWSASQSH